MRGIANPTRQPSGAAAGTILRADAGKLGALRRSASGEVAVPVTGQAAVQLEELLPPPGRRRRGRARRAGQRLERLARLHQVRGDGADLDRLELPGLVEALAVEVLVQSVDAWHARAGQELGRIAEPIGHIGRVRLFGEVPQARPDLGLPSLLPSCGKGLGPGRPFRKPPVRTRPFS